MNTQMKQNLEKVIKGLINDDSKTAGDALHEYLRAKAQSIIIGEDEDADDKDDKEVKGDDEEAGEKKAADVEDADKEDEDDEKAEKDEKEEKDEE